MKKEKLDIIFSTFVEQNGDWKKTVSVLRKSFNIRISLSRLIDIIKSNHFDLYVEDTLQLHSSIIRLKAYQAMLQLFDEIKASLSEDDSIFSATEKMNFFSKLVSYINQYERTNASVNAVTKSDDPVTNLKLKIQREHELQNYRESNVIKI